METLAIRTLDLTRDFGATRAVDRLTLEVPAGSLAGIVGQNGAGKSTTIRLLLGLIAPTSGRAEVMGLDVSTDAARVRATSGVLLEHSGLYERLSVEENLEFHARLRKVPRDVRHERLRDVLDRVGLWEQRAMRVADLSRGMAQKAAIARALLHRPAILFLDEPTANLDPVAASSLRRDLVALAAADGITVIVTSHNLAEVDATCDLVVVMDHGRLRASGTPAALRAAHGAASLEAVFLELVRGQA